MRLPSILVLIIGAHLLAPPRPLLLAMECAQPRAARGEQARGVGTQGVAQPAALRSPALVPGVAQAAREGSALINNSVALDPLILRLTRQAAAAHSNIWLACRRLFCICL